jgi:hypothetical protein
MMGALAGAARSDPNGRHDGHRQQGAVHRDQNDLGAYLRFRPGFDGVPLTPIHVGHNFPLCHRSTPEAGWFVARGHREPRPAYFPKVFYSADHPTEAGACVHTQIADAPSRRRSGTRGRDYALATCRASTRSVRPFGNGLRGSIFLLMTGPQAAEPSPLPAGRRELASVRCQTARLPPTTAIKESGGAACDARLLPRVSLPCFSSD